MLRRKQTGSRGAAVIPHTLFACSIIAGDSRTGDGPASLGRLHLSLDLPLSLLLLFGQQRRCTRLCLGLLLLFQHTAGLVQGLTRLYVCVRMNVHVCVYIYLSVSMCAYRKCHVNTRRRFYKHIAPKLSCTHDSMCVCIIARTCGYACMHACACIYQACRKRPMALKKSAWSRKAAIKSIRRW